MKAEDLQRTMSINGKKIRQLLTVNVPVFGKRGRFTSHDVRRVTFTDGSVAEFPIGSDVPGVSGYAERFIGEHSRTNPYGSSMRVRASDGKWRGESNGAMGEGITRLNTRQHDQITRMPGWGRTIRDEKIGR